MSTNVNNASTDEDVARLLGTEAVRPVWRRAWVWGLGVGALLVGLAWVVWWPSHRQPSGQARYVTEPVTRGALTLTVSANGTLQPTRSVSVGSELSGTVAQVLVDVNDPVKEGQVLVELDTARLKAQIVRSEAGLASAQAKVEQARATVQEARSSVARLEEVHRLSGGKVPSKSDLEAAVAALNRAVADERSARASVADAQAALSSDRTNLTKASIRSPIDGVVLTRTVEPGQAVAASLQAVTLLTLASDLRDLKLQVKVDEADVGLVRPGQQAEFTVSSVPNRAFPATIQRVAYGAGLTDNVVTYTTDLAVRNEDMSLRPGMTASARIASTPRDQVLLVPNAALRFMPSSASSAPGAIDGAGGSSAAGGGSIVSRLMPRPPGGGSSGSNHRRSAGDAQAAGQATRQVWVWSQDQLKPLTVAVGLSDGRHTEVSSAELQEGMAVVTEQRSAAAAGGAAP